MKALRLLALLFALLATLPAGGCTTMDGGGQSTSGSSRGGY